ncbi:hypothetical protein GCM10023324_49000 [Streptomyces youssoufiensis]
MGWYLGAWLPVVGSGVRRWNSAAGLGSGGAAVPFGAGFGGTGRGGGAAAGDAGGGGGGRTAAGERRCGVAPPAVTGGRGWRTAASPLGRDGDRSRGLVSTARQRVRRVAAVQKNSEVTGADLGWCGWCDDPPRRAAAHTVS